MIPAGRPPSTSDAASRERDRIRQEYERRRTTIPRDFYSLVEPANLFHWQQRTRHALNLFRQSNLLPLAGRRVLEVGCGEGGWLADFELWGVRRRDLAAIELDPEPTALVQKRFGEEADIRCGDASSLPWPEGHFDIVVQSTVFTSVLDVSMRRTMASEMVRVLKLGGVVLWYDFFVDNPWNAHVRGVRRREIESLFTGCQLDLRRITLAPPLARRIVPLSWGLASAFEMMRVLNTHYLGLIRKR